MRKLYIPPAPNSPEIHFSSDENILLIRGTSSPEDVRAMYYPVIEWINEFVSKILEGVNTSYSPENPVKLQVDLTYFNSSSAKFLYDILSALKKLTPSGIPVIVEWFYDKDDVDMKEAGIDIALLAEMEFSYTPKNN